MKRVRFAAVACLACLGLVLLSGCGGGSGLMISIELETPTGILSMDESQPAPAPPNAVNITATVGGDTKASGVTWMFEAKQSGCAGNGLAIGDCGTLTNNAAFGVTYTAPAITATTSVVIEATSVAEPSVTKTITFSIVLPPVFATTECNQGVLPCTLANGNNAVPYSQSFTFTGGVQPYTYTIPVGALPNCLKLNATSTSTTGTIVGTPCGSGTSTFTIQVTDSGGAIPVSQVFIIMIAPPPTLSVTQAPLPAATLDGIYSGSIATQGGVAPLTWTVTSGNLPPGLSLNGGTGQITGIPIDESHAAPPVVYPAIYAFDVQVKDSSLPTPQKAPIPPAQFTITVQAPQPLLISTPSPLASGTTGTSYAATLNASGGVPPYTWTVTQGQLPAGLSLSSTVFNTGSITGVPVLTTVATFTVQVSDSAVNPANGNPAPDTNTASFQITIGAGTTNNALLSGAYTFFFNGFDSDGPVQLIGGLTANGSGSITAGSVESNRVSGVALGGSIVPPQVPPSATVPGSTYAIGSGGRGTLELMFAFGANSPIIADFDLVLDSNGNAKFFEDYTTKTNKDPKHTHGEGVMKPVTGPATFGNINFAGNYAFELPGYDLTAKPVALAGVIHADGNQTLTPPGASGSNSDFNDAGTYSFQAISGDYTFGAGTRGTAALTFAPGTQPQMTLNFIFYFVNPSDLYFIEADSDKNTGLPTMFRLAGEAILQQTNTAFDQSVMQGVSVASGTGVGASGNASVFAGLLTSTLCNQNAPVSLAYDENNGGTINGGAVPPISFTGATCAINTNGRVSFTGLGTSAAATRVAAAYLTGPGQGFLIGSDTAVTTGRLEQQTITSFAPTSFLGGYTLTTPFIAEPAVKNVIGQTTADGVGTVAGTVDEIDPTGAAAPNLAQILSADFTSPAPSGRGTLTGTGTVPSGFPTNSIFYVVSPSSVRIVSEDTTDTHPQLILLDH
jgi:Putative Ig domain